MSKWEKFCNWFWGEGEGILIIAMSILAGILVLSYSCHKDFKSRYDYKIKVMDSKYGTTYYAKRGDIEIVDGILFIKPSNITTTTFTITPIDKD